MKAFEIKCSLVDSVGFYAAPTAGKAKWCAVQGLLESGYANHDETKALRSLQCRRRPDLDKWASQFSAVRGYVPDVVCCDLK